MMDLGKSWMLTVEEDEQGELMLTLPPDLLASADWHEGDVLQWMDRGDGSWELKKQQKNEQSEPAAS